MSEERGWRSTAAENPEYRCKACGSNEIKYRKVESSDGAYEDINYICMRCGREWWYESSDY